MGFWSMRTGTIHRATLLSPARVTLFLLAIAAIAIGIVLDANVGTAGTQAYVWIWGTVLVGTLAIAIVLSGILLERRRRRFFEELRESNERAKKQVQRFSQSPKQELPQHHK